MKCDHCKLGVSECPYASTLHPTGQVPSPCPYYKSETAYREEEYMKNLGVSLAQGFLNNAISSYTQAASSETLNTEAINSEAKSHIRNNMRSALISVQCFYSIDIPEDMQFANEDEEAKWALKKFRETQLVDVVERLHGDNSFIEKSSRTLDGRVKNFDMVQVDNITNDAEIEELLEKISKGGKN